MSIVADNWTDLVSRVLQLYDEDLLRHVATRLFRPRNQWPTEELIERTLATINNVPVLDRRLKDLPAACRQVLALIALSKQPRWAVGNLVEMLVTLGHPNGLEPVQTLLETGLLFPEYFPTGPHATQTRLRDFSFWIAQAHRPTVFAPPLITARVLNEPLASCPGVVTLDNDRPVLREADGLEWPLRLAVLWQQVVGAPLRRTQQGDFFKRDLDRLRADPLLASQPHDALCEVPDPGLCTVALAVATGLLQEKDGELVAQSFPVSWQEGLAPTLATIWSGLPFLRGWGGANGWQPAEMTGNPYPSAHLLSLVLLSQLTDGQWAQPQALEDWILARHPYWIDGKKTTEEPAGRGRPPKAKSAASSGPARTVTAFLLGVAFPLRLLHATKGPDGDWLVRLSPLGRWVLGLGDKPPAGPGFPQTLLVQPNLEILAYRQGLTPELIVRLSRFATWKGIGAACTLQLEPASVYRALESGESFTSLVQALEHHGMKAMPPAVLDSLRTWSNKRDRITVYPAGALFEFAGPAELTEALARGLPAVRLTDRLAIVPGEKDIDYRHFRLTGTRDYHLPPEKCVDVEEDGVTLGVDLQRSDLLLETELAVFAEPLPQPVNVPNRKAYRLTPTTVAVGKKNGLTLAGLESWFLKRTGGPLPSATHLLLTGPESPPVSLQRQLVLHLATEEQADGLEQWPGTRSLFTARLGPTALTLLDENVPALREKLRELGIALSNLSASVEA